jgi:Formin Homology 2 Domain/Subunit CCDC53 of WASH complex
MESRLGGDGGVRGSRYGQSSPIDIQKDGRGSLLNGAIQLNDRQLKILEARKANRSHLIQQQTALSPKKLPYQPEHQQQEQQHRSLDHMNPKAMLSKGGYKLVDSQTVASSGTRDEYWAQEPTNTVETVPTTWSESASSAVGSATSSGNDSFSETAKHFYGQRLSGKEKKLYDDTGATWNDSRSEVSTSTAAISKTSSAPTYDVMSSHSFASGSRKSYLSSASHSPKKQPMQSKQEVKSIEHSRSYSGESVAKPEGPNVYSAEKASLAGSSVYHENMRVNRQDSMTLRTESESEDETLMPLQSRSESFADAEPHHRPPLSPLPTKLEAKTPQVASKPPRFQNKEKKPKSFSEKLRSKLFKNRDPKKTAEMAEDLARNIINNSPMIPSTGMTSIEAKSPKQDSTHEKFEQAGSDISSKSSDTGSKKRFSMMKAIRSPRSASSGPSISQEEKMIMKRFASLSSKNPRRENLVKTGSTKMKQMFSSKQSVSDQNPEASMKQDQTIEERAQTATNTEDAETLETEIESRDRFDASMLPLSPFKPTSTGGGRARRSSVRLKMVTSQVMNDLIEENVIPESDEEDGDEDDVDDQPSIQKAQSIRSLPDIVRDDEIEVNISKASENECSSNAFEGRRVAPSNSSQATTHVAHATQRALEQINNEEPDGYSDFVNRLKCELAGSHSKLFDQFHAMVRGDGSEPKPLSMYPGGLDLKTKETITSMSSYAKGTIGVDCMTGSQMTSDKDIEKMKPGQVFYGQQLLKPTNTASASLTHSHHVQSERSRREIGDTFLSETAPSDSPTATSSDSISAGSQGMAYEVTLSQHIRKSIMPSPANSSGEDTCREMKATFSSESVATSNETIFDEALTSRTSKSSKAKDISPKMFVPPSEKESVPWTSVKLRSVSEKSRDACDDEKMPVSWAKVRLRPVEKVDVKENVIDTSSDSVETEEFHRIVLRKTPTNACTPQNNLALALAPSASTDVSGTETKPINIERNGISATQPIKLTETRGTGERPIKIEDKSSGTEWNPIKLANEGSVMISLADENSISGAEMKLIMSKNGLMKVEAIPGESKANVLWRLDREEVKSALMNMSALSVKLIVSTGDQHHKDLHFPSSAKCKQFANALHDLLHGSNDDLQDATELERDELVATAQESSVYVEQLSEDEQKVLEEFRQRKKTAKDPKADFAKEFLKISAGSSINKLPSVVNACHTGPASPLSEVSGANSILSVKQTNTADTYRKMLRMKVPKESVRHKMMKDTIDPHIIESVLAEESQSTLPMKDNQKLSPTENKVAESYRRMLKMGVPAEGVRHKMQKDGVSSKILAAVIVDEPQPTTKDADGGPKLSIVEEAVAETYRKMLKMMIPKEAVQHRMIKDGVDPKIMAVVIGKPPEQPKANGDPMASNNKLTDSEESIASAYRKMLKLSIPKEAVRHKMTQEGISEKIMIAVLGANPSKTAGQKTPQKRGLKPGFHWNPIADDESIAGSVWSKAKPMSDAGTQKPEVTIDISKHVEMFQKQPDNVMGKKKGTTKSNSDAKEMAKLIDLNRANNVAITLKAFNDFTHMELAQIIEFLDPQGKVKGDRALFMKDLLPVPAETKAIKSYKGGEDRLVTAEKWFKQIVHIKRIEEKIEVMRTMETFKMDAIVLGKSFQLLTKVCNQVMDSDRLPDLLDMVRQIGNTMNEGRGEAAAGFKLDFLPRLAQTKGSDKKTTALDLVVMLFHVRNQREALMLSTEIPDCQEASRIQLSDLLTDVRTLEASLRKCKRELEHLKMERESSLSGKPPPTRDLIPTDSRSDTALGNELRGPNCRGSQDAKTDIAGGSSGAFQNRSDLIASMLKHHQAETSKEDHVAKSPRASLVASLQEGGGLELEFSLDASIRRLEKFVSESSYVILPRLDAERVEAVESCKDLASFFCESGGERAASNLLKILDEFASGIDRAVVKYDQQQKADARKKATQKRKSLTGSKPPAPETGLSGNPTTAPSETTHPHPETAAKTSQQESREDAEKKSLVLMVNEMLKMAGDKQVKDFMQGVVYDNPDDRLKKIYEAEKSRKDPFAARREMMSAIEAKRSSMDIQDAQETTMALSELQSSFDASKNALDSIQKHNNEADDTLSEMPSCSNLRRKSRIAARWTRKIEGDDCAETNNEHKEPTEKTDSEILSSVSQEAEDRTYRRKKRQSYMERWASHTPVSEACSVDLDAESDVGAFEAMLNKQRQKAIDRWSRKPADDEIVE